MVYIRGYASMVYKLYRNRNLATVFFTFLKKVSQNFPAITLKGIAVSAQYMYIAPVTLHAKIDN